MDTPITVTFEPAELRSLVAHLNKQPVNENYAPFKEACRKLRQAQITASPLEKKNARE